MIKGLTVSCLIPAYNEEGRVGKVLDSIKNIDLIDEIIVVDDGSKDNTFEEILKYKSDNIQIIKNKVNKGKSFSVFRAFDMSSGDLILMLDADIVGLKESHIEEMLDLPTSECCMTMFTLSNSPVMSKLMNCSIWSGIRVVPRCLFQKWRKCDTSGYALEPYLNEIVLKSNIPFYSYIWEDVTSYRKWQKVGLMKGSYQDIKMSFELGQKYSFMKNFLQLFVMPIKAIYYKMRMKYKLK